MIDYSTVRMCSDFALGWVTRPHFYASFMATCCCALKTVTFIEYVYFCLDFS